MRVVDLRSDTVTRPSAAMRKAMADAEVGDDVLDGDPTTRILEERTAELLGKEAALFFPSGTQANQVAIHVLCPRGTELVVEANAHIVHYEKSGAAVLSGVQLFPIVTRDGRLDAEDVTRAIRTGSRFTPRTGAITLENTHNAAGGVVLPVEATDAISAAAARHELPLHLDGARLWNAAAFLTLPMARLAQGASTVMVSYSKGLGCPVGSCLAGSRHLMAAAWEARARFGGAMRQSGILAAACLYGLEHNLARLPEDHAHARLLAERLVGRVGFSVTNPQTNIVMLDLMTRSADDALRILGERGIKLSRFGPRRIRAVTHLDVTRADVEHAAHVIGETIGG